MKAAWEKKSRTEKNRAAEKGKGKRYRPFVDLEKKTVQKKKKD